jgi:hypothetical protein
MSWLLKNRFVTPFDDLHAMPGGTRRARVAFVAARGMALPDAGAHALQLAEDRGLGRLGIDQQLLASTESKGPVARASACRLAAGQPAVREGASITARSVVVRQCRCRSTGR